MDHAGRLLRKMNLPPELNDPETRARAVWPRAAGKIVARHTTARSLVRGTLIAEVEDQVWQRQLSPLRHALVRNLEKELGERIVTEIDFRPAPGRRAPQSATSARRDPAEIQDPVLAMLYERSRRAAG